MTSEPLTLDHVLEKQLQNPEFRQAYDDLEPAYQVARLRIRRGLSQKQLAELVGTKQPSIARLESGQVAPRLSFLKRVVEALGGTLTIHINAPSEVPVLAESEPVYHSDPPADPST
jgi:transcriptional regulator with XRE-family HTH domain